jgi:outer membrane protein insertion porin family
MGKPIKNIVFQGLRHVRANELDGITDDYIGKNFSDDLFSELQGRLYALEYFDELSPEPIPADDVGSSVILRFKVVERPVVSKISFKGNAGIRISELRDDISIKPNDVYNETKMRIDEQTLVAKYIEKGYPNATVRGQADKSSDSSVAITFNISEGERIVVTTINFEGNTYFSVKTLRGKLSLKQKGAFQESKLVMDRYTIAQYYHERGYSDAEVTDVTRDISVVAGTEKKLGNTNLAVTFKIYEGPRYIFDGITFEGNKIFTTEELQALVRSRVGRIVNAQALEGDLQRIADLYYENGYIDNSIERKEQRNIDEHTIGYVVQIVERDRAFVENIIVRGNKKTKDYVILREIPLESGDVFSKAKVLEGLRNLYNLQYFTTNIIPETPRGSAEGLMDLVFTVEEQPTTDVQAGLTFTGSTDPDAFPVSLMASITDRNFLGRGNTFGVSVNASVSTQDVSVQYTQKWLFGLPLSGGFDLSFAHSTRLGLMDNQAPYFNGNETYAYPDGFTSYDDYYSSGSVPPDEYLFKYDQWGISTGFSTGYRWSTPVGNLGVGGNIRIGFKYNKYDREKNRAFDPAIRDRDLWTPATSLAFSVSLDDRDIYYDPSKGYYLLQRLGMYGLLPNMIEEEYFMRTDSKAEVYFTLWNWHVSDAWSFKGVLALHTGLSFYFPFGRSEDGPFDTPIVEQANMLALDGMFTARGWTDERLTRGLAQWENWAELRIPVMPGVLALDGFFDAAEIADEPSNIFTGDSRDSFAGRLRFSYGFGLRFAIPQFPFRFMLAKLFRLENGHVVMEGGPIGGSTSDPTKGMQFVLSFAIPTS